MKSLIYTLFILLVISPPAEAQWAKHLVVGPTSVRKQPPAEKVVDEYAEMLAVEAAKAARALVVSDAGEGRIRVTVDGVEKTSVSGKGYYCVTALNRFATNQLNLRPIISDWRIGRISKGSSNQIEGALRLLPTPVGGTNRIEVILDRPTAMRSYLVWDFPLLFETTGWAMVHDGGFWFTYDLPAFIEAHEAKKSTAPR